MGLSAFAQRVLDAVYGGPLAEDALYFKGGLDNPSIACRVKPGGTEQGLDLAGFGSSPVVDDGQVKVRVSEVANPQAGDVFIIDPEGRKNHYEITQAPERFDKARLEWTCVTTVPTLPDV